MGRFVPIAIAFVVMLYAFIDVLQSRGSDVRTFPRAIWAIVVIVLPVLGALGWFVLGRPRRADAGGGRPGRRGGPVAPDDDPSFLRELEARTWSEQMRRRREQGSTASEDATRRDPSPEDEPRSDGPAVDSGSPGPVD